MLQQFSQVAETKHTARTHWLREAEQAGIYRWDRGRTGGRMGDRKGRRLLRGRGLEE